MQVGILAAASLLGALTFLAWHWLRQPKKHALTAPVAEPTVTPIPAPPPQLPEQLGPDEILMFNHGRGRFEVLAAGVVREARTTPAVDACVELSIALAELCERCADAPDEDTYHTCWDETEGETCYEAREVRDLTVLRSACIPAVAKTDCRSYRRSDFEVPASCANQVTFSPSVDNADTFALQTTLTASSVHPPGGGYSFEPANLVDSDQETSWQPSSSDGAPWVRFVFESEVTLRGVRIANGFQTHDRFGDEFLLNSRIADAHLEFTNGTSVPLHFAADARGLITFDVGRQRTRSVTLRVDTRHRGSRWEDLAVSEFSFDVHSEVPATTVDAPTPRAATAVDAPTSRATSPDQPASTIRCHAWFDMTRSQQVEAATRVGEEVRRDYEREAGRGVERMSPSDIASFVEAFTTLCKAGGKEDLYALGWAAAQVAYGAWEQR